MIDGVLENSIRGYAAERGFRPATVARWLALDAPDATALWELARDLRPGENQMRDLWEWAAEIAAREAVSLSQVLSQVMTASGRGGRNERLKQIKAALRRRRFPLLAAAEERVAARIRDLRLPPGVRVTVPDNLEGDQVRIEFSARSAAALRAAAEAVARAASTAACEEIFELLSDPPEPKRGV